MFRAVLVLSALAVLLPVAPANAGVTYALCGMSGCSCYASDESPQDVMDRLGADFDIVENGQVDPTSGTLVIDQPFNAIYWSSASRNAIDRSSGGDGSCDIQLFDPLIPRDGVWRWNTTGTIIEGCPDMMASMLASGLGDSHSTRVNWGGRFDPAKLANQAEMSVYDWRDLGGESWRTLPLGDSGCQDGVCQSISLRLWMTLVSETRVRGHLNYDMKIDAGPQAASVLAGFGMDSCRITVKYTIDHVSD